VDQLRDSLATTAKTLTFTIIAHLSDGLLDSITVSGRNARMVPIDRECNVG
jgi:hypothetical protein